MSLTTGPRQPVEVLCVGRRVGVATRRPVGELGAASGRLGGLGARVEIEHSCFGVRVMNHVLMCGIGYPHVMEFFGQGLSVAMCWMFVQCSTLPE